MKQDKEITKENKEKLKSIVKQNTENQLVPSMVAKKYVDVENNTFESNIMKQLSWLD